jgi:hypothetical protein
MILCFLHSCLSLSVRPPVTLPVGLGHVDVGFPPTFGHTPLCVSRVLARVLETGEFFLRCVGRAADVGDHSPSVWPHAPYRRLMGCEARIEAGKKLRHASCIRIMYIVRHLLRSQRRALQRFQQSSALGHRRPRLRQTDGIIESFSAPEPARASRACC